jgi:hypothetical protein
MAATPDLGRKKLSTEHCLALKSPLAAMYVADDYMTCVR